MAFNEFGANKVHVYKKNTEGVVIGAIDVTNYKRDI